MVRLLGSFEGMDEKELQKLEDIKGLKRPQFKEIMYGKQKKRSLKVKLSYLRFPNGSPVVLTVLTTNVSS